MISTWRFMFLTKTEFPRLQDRLPKVEPFKNNFLKENTILNYKMMIMVFLNCNCFLYFLWWTTGTKDNTRSYIDINNTFFQNVIQRIRIKELGPISADFFHRKANFSWFFSTDRLIFADFFSLKVQFPTFPLKMKLVKCVLNT